MFIKQILETAGLLKAFEETGYAVSTLDHYGCLARALSQKGCLKIADILYGHLSHRLPGGKSDAGQR